MKRISSWANNHKGIARNILILSYTLLNVTALFLGDILHSMDIEFTAIFFQVAIVMTLLSWMIYPVQQRKRVYKNLYARQKLADFVLVSATFLFVIYAGNAQNSSRNTFGNQGRAASIIDANNKTTVPTTSEANKKVSKKSLRKKLKAEIINLRNAYKNSTDAQKKLYVTLAIIGGILLGSAIIAVSCSIACSGSEALGLVLLFGGVAGVIFGVIRIVQRIKRGHPKKRKT